MHRENLLINDRRDRQAVETVGECLPQLDVVAPFACRQESARRSDRITRWGRRVGGGSTHTFIVEPVDSVDTGTLVVPSQDEEVLGVLDLVCQQKADSLERLLAAVNVVA